jgi:hypothetical protein
MGKAVINQSSFRGRDDSQALNSSTFTYNEGADWTQNADTTFRCRFELEETAAGSQTISPQLEYYHAEGTATWTNVTTSSNVVRAVSSAQPTFTEGAACSTDLLTASSESFDNTGNASVDGLGADTTLSNECAEFEFCMQIRSADTTDADTVYIKVTDAGADFNSYGTGSDPALSNIPLLTVNIVELPTEEKHAATILAAGSGAMTGRVYV